MIVKLVNSGVRAKVLKAGKKLFPTLAAPGETRKDHDYVRIDHRYESFDIAIEPSTVDSFDC